MSNVISKKCIVDNCNKQPTFNYINLKGAYCSEHKKDNMINVVNKPCISENCTKRATYNLKTESNPLFCNKHKTPDMINFKCNYCIENNCTAIAYYNLKTESKPKYCSTHKLNDMIRVVARHCKEKGCMTVPNFNYVEKRSGIYCFNHKKDNMVNVVSKICKTPLCNTQITMKYKGYCMRCFIYLFPNDILSRNYKTREKYVVDYITNEFTNLTIINDKKIIDGCSNRRPDLLIDLGDQVIIVEIDENQHINYDCTCENKRLMEISKDIGHRPLISIRFNPDNYAIQDKNVSSCWKENRFGILCIKKGKETEWDERLQLLKETIQYWINNKTDKTVEYIPLFFDY